jgi:hypothetical protein
MVKEFLIMCITTKEFEGKILNIYADMFGVEENGEHKPPTLTKEGALTLARFYYKSFVSDDRLKTDNLSHETVCIMYDLGVELNKDDPLRQKLWFTHNDKTDGKPISNPYNILGFPALLRYDTEVELEEWLPKYQGVMA